MEPPAVLPGSPFVLRGAARSWPAFGRWSPEYLASALPDRRVPVAALDGLRLRTDARRGVMSTEVPLGEFVASLARAPSGYMMIPLDQLPPSLAGELGELELCRGARWRRAKLWLSPAGAVSPLHFDVPHNLHVVLHGRKRFVLYRRGDWRALYRQPLSSGVPNFSRVDPERPDLARYPRFRRARRLEYVVEAGDALCIPGGVWHQATSEVVSVAVNFWWARGLHALVAAAANWAKTARGVSR